MQRIWQLLQTLFNSGIDENQYDDRQRRILVVNLFSFVGMSLTLLMAITASFNQNWLLAFVLFIASTAFSFGYICQRKTGNTNVASNIILYCLTLLLIYLIYTGGVNNTGPLWAFLLPPVTLFLHGLKRGLIDLACFLVIMCAMFFSSDYALIATNYDPDFTSRLILCFLTVTFLSAFYEYSREASYKKTLEISQEFERLAKKDSLTKLSNRRDAMDKLEYEYSRMQRTNQPFTVLLCDIDHFKLINDNYGHDIGDKALVALASLFKSLIRAQDTVARWGGEEFIFLLPQTSLAQAQVFAEKLHLQLSQMTISTEHGDVSCTLSAGLCQSESKLSISEILKKADNALYLAKNNGRNRTEAHID